MEPFLYSFFHDKTNDRSEDGFVNIPANRDLWPIEWKISESKSYTRLPKLFLSDSTSDSQLESLLRHRHSTIDTLTTQSVTEADLSNLLKAGYGFIKTSKGSKRTVPSGGALYPLELYVAIWGEVSGIPSGNYHYDIKAHALSHLPAPQLTAKDIPHFTKYSWVQRAHGIILVSAVFERSVQKYGSRGYRYILLEAGHVGQNISLAAAEQNIAVRALGGISESYFEDLLQLDVAHERIVYALVF